LQPHGRRSGKSSIHALSPDGKWLAQALTDGFITSLWTLSTTTDEGVRLPISANARRSSPAACPGRPTDNLSWPQSPRGTVRGDVARSFTGVPLVMGPWRTTQSFVQPGSKRQKAHTHPALQGYVLSVQVLPVVSTGFPLLFLTKKNEHSATASFGVARALRRGKPTRDNRAANRAGIGQRAHPEREVLSRSI
jgi:hypothetical protein